jgi:hypothetical protein
MDDVQIGRLTLTVKDTALFHEGTRVIVDGDPYWVTKVIDAHTVALMPEPKPAPSPARKSGGSTWNFLLVLLLLMLITYLIRL